jgi:hypothetical protein
MKVAQENDGKSAAGTERGSSRLLRWLTGPVEALPLRVFEIWVAVTFPLRMVRNLPYSEWLTSEGYHVTASQWWALGYPEALPLLPSWGPWVFIAVIVLAVAGLICDLRRRRLWLGVLLACALYAQGVDYLAATSANKQYIGIFFLLFTGPGLGRCSNTGRWMVSAAALRALQGTILVIYFSAGWSKAFAGDWLTYSDVLYTQVQGSHRTEFAAWALRTWPLWFWTLNQHLALVFELGAPLLLGLRKLRPIGFVLGLGMHLIIALTMYQLVYFSLLMWAYYALFVSAEQWRVLARLPGQVRVGGSRALIDEARRFWEGWTGGRRWPEVPAWVKVGWERTPGLAVYGGAILLLWLLPFFHVGWKGRSWSVFPRWWGVQHEAAGLFTQRSTAWWDHHLEFQGSKVHVQEGTGVGAAPGAELGGAIELAERDFFPMGAFGYRTRLDRILNESQRSPMRDHIRERLAAHVAGLLKAEEGGAMEAPGGELRLVRSLWRVGDPGMAQPAGAWDPPDVTTLDPKQRLVLGGWKVDEDGTVMLATKAHEPPTRVANRVVPPNRGTLEASRNLRGETVANPRIKAAKAMVARLRAEGRLPLAPAGAAQGGVKPQPSSAGIANDQRVRPTAPFPNRGRPPLPPPPMRSPGGKPLPLPAKEGPPKP